MTLGRVGRDVYRQGHYGVAMLVYAPVGLALLSFGPDEIAVLGGGLMIGLTTLPDVDHRLPLVGHRGATHTLAFAVLVGAVVGGAGWLIAPGFASTPWRVAVLGFVIGTLAILAHLLADVITPSGLRLLWPLSKRRYSLSLVRADNTVANYLLLLFGVLSVLLVLGMTRAG